MKRAVSLLFLLSLLVLFACCSASASPADTFLTAAGEWKIDAMTEMMTPETAASLGERLTEDKERLDPSKQEVLRRLYSHLSYTVESQTQASDGRWTFTIEVTIPDMQKILEYADAEILVSGETAGELITRMLDEGTIAQDFMTEETIDVLFEQRDGEWKIPYSETENTALVRLLSLDETLRFFVLN